MRKYITLVLLLAIYMHPYCQKQELELFRQEMTAFVKFDLANKIESPSITQEKDSLLKSMEKAFLAFAHHKESHDAEKLKEMAKNNDKGIHFFELRRDYSKQSKENNIDLVISFHGVYDYALSNFVSIYIQPFRIANAEYVVYHYKLNGKGKYFIKHVKKNKMVLEQKAYTSNAAIKNIQQIDKNHFLIIEDFGDSGQRAFVVDNMKNRWVPINSFKGMALPSDSPYYSKDSKMEFVESRVYLLLASNKVIFSDYGMQRRCLIAFDEASKIISYANGHEKENVVTAIWKDGIFEIDDYYLGRHLVDEPVPYPN